jgi:hypothetical protein
MIDPPVEIVPPSYEAVVPRMSHARNERVKQRSMTA